MIVKRCTFAIASLLLFWGSLGAMVNAQAIRFGAAIAQTLPKMVKINGSGGTGGLEAYQSGMMISAEGHLLTVWSYVLDSSVITVTMNDGFKSEAKLIGFDPRLDIAVLKIPVSDTSFFSLDRVSNVEVGDRVIAFSNLYNVATGDEPVSIQQGFVSSISNLSARQGTYDSPYQEKALLIDAMTNNPGSAGGAVTDRTGQLIGMIGKEVRDRRSGNWLNYALPIENLSGSIEQILNGTKQIAAATNDAERLPTEPMSGPLLGISLVPSIVKRTPPYIDRIAAGSAADSAGLKADDLIIEINGAMTSTALSVVQQLLRVDRDEVVRITVQRGNRFLERALRLTR